MRSLSIGLLYYVIITAGYGILNSMSDVQRGVKTTKRDGERHFSFVATGEFDGKAKQFYLNRSLVMEQTSNTTFTKYNASYYYAGIYENVEDKGFLIGLSYFESVSQYDSYVRFESYNVWMPLSLPFYIFAAIKGNV